MSFGSVQVQNVVTSFDGGEEAEDGVPDLPGSFGEPPTNMARPIAPAALVRPTVMLTTERVRAGVRARNENGLAMDNLQPTFSRDGQVATTTHLGLELRLFSNIAWELQL